MQQRRDAPAAADLEPGGPRPAPANRGISRPAPSLPAVRAGRPGARRPWRRTMPSLAKGSGWRYQCWRCRSMPAKSVAGRAAALSAKPSSSGAPGDRPSARAEWLPDEQAEVLRLLTDVTACHQAGDGAACAEPAVTADVAGQAPVSSPCTTSRPLAGSCVSSDGDAPGVLRPVLPLQASPRLIAGSVCRPGRRG
jgi:hypothetical protein